VWFFRGVSSSPFPFVVLFLSRPSSLLLVNTIRPLPSARPSFLGRRVVPAIAPSLSAILARPSLDDTLRLLGDRRRFFPTFTFLLQSRISPPPRGRPRYRVITQPVAPTPLLESPFDPEEHAGMIEENQLRSRVFPPDLGPPLPNFLSLFWRMSFEPSNFPYSRLHTSSTRKATTWILSCAAQESGLKQRSRYSQVFRTFALYSHRLTRSWQPGKNTIPLPGPPLATDAITVSF